MSCVIFRYGFLFVVLSLASSSFAQDPGSGAGGGGFGRPAFELDEQGRIDLSKLPDGMPAPFAEGMKKLDANGDGFLDADEQKALSALRGGRGGGRQTASPTVPIEKMRASLSDAERADLEALRASMVAEGIAFLTKSQSEDGSFSASPRVGIGPTLIDVAGLLRAGVKLDEPILAKALAFLEKSVREDGGIYSEGLHLSTYESCLGLVCFTLANRQAGDGRYDAIVEKAEKFVRGSQYNKENGVEKEDEYFGGVGYGKGAMTRPDLSNTQFFVEALREIGAGEDDPAIQDALTFVSRCQNFETGDVVSSGRPSSNDGGFFYTFVAGEENPAGEEVDGGLRSYGSITYAGLKSLIYAGLTPDDPRVEAATGWIRQNYTLTQNPGLGKRGLYYYYHTLSKCFQVLGEDLFEDSNGKKHDWRRELIEALALAENADGSWVNENRYWYENDPNLVTGYVLIVLSYCER
ncbi:MAG: terpene cyclase/mutase family protein [Thermoguttaceae bacterium]|nr:terpene cyclase/mutase family protein [Thermoguttaceae bacterium]